MLFSLFLIKSSILQQHSCFKNKQTNIQLSEGTDWVVREPFAITDPRGQRECQARNPLLQRLPVYSKL